MRKRKKRRTKEGPAVATGGSRGAGGGAGGDVPVLGERHSEGNAWAADKARRDVRHGRFSAAEKATLRSAVQVRALHRCCSCWCGTAIVRCASLRGSVVRSEV